MLSKGHLSLSGGMLSPFQGTDGLVAKLHFRALRSGQAELSFEKSNLYLSDGKGTKNSINSAPITLSISSNAPATELPSVPIDTTPPSLKVSLIKDPVSGNYLIFYAPSGTGSGIRIIEMRTQAWWNWGDWQEITGNPIVFPARAWGVEIRIRNNNGEEAAQFIAAPFPYLKAFIIISVCIILILILLYNKRRRMS